MATIPRYQNLGLQYSELPRVSTALQQARATGFDQLSRSLDRMSAYFASEAETQVKKEAIKYAVDNPITSQQLEAALKDPQALKIEGAGSVFQETYQAAAATQLSSELQLQASSELKRIELDAENGNIDPMAATVRMQDLLDGQSALMRAVSPEYSVKHRAALATLAATSRNKIYDTQQKAYLAEEGAKLDEQLQKLPQDLRDAIRYNASSIDPETGKPVDIQKLMEVQLVPFRESVKTMKTSAYLNKALAMISEAKIDALSEYLSDRTVNRTASEMSDKFLTGNFGDLTRVYKSLSQKEKDDVYARSAQSFTTQYTATKNAKSLADDEDKVKGKALALRVLSGNLSASEKRRAVLQMVSLDYITFQSGDEMLKPKDPPANPRLEFDLLRQISRGTLTTDKLIEQSPNLSNSQFVSLGKALINSEDAEAKRVFKSIAGIIEGQQVIGDSKILIYGLLDRNYMELRKLANPDGTPKYTPQQAREEAIKKYEVDKTARDKAEKRQNSETNIRDDLGDVAKDIPIEKINLDHPAIKSIPGMSSKKLDRLRDQQKIYINNMDR